MTDEFPQEIEIDDAFGKDPEKPIERGEQLAPSRILNGAINADLDLVLVLGWQKDGGFYAASTQGDKREILWLVEQFKQGLMNGKY